MIEAQPLPSVALPQRRAKFSGGFASRLRTPGLTPRDPAVEALAASFITLPLFLHRAYIGAMTQNSTGPVATEITRRLTEALNPSHLAVIDDSHRHAGHAGHDARGESHFTVEIVSAEFEGQNRVARQRAVNKALADLLAERVHALAIRAKAPSELS